MVKGIKIGQEEIKISQFADDKNFYGWFGELFTTNTKYLGSLKRIWYGLAKRNTPWKNFAVLAL